VYEAEVHVFIHCHTRSKESRLEYRCLSLIVDWWVDAVVVFQSFDLWYIEKTKFCYEDDFDVSYQWFSSLWNGFWLEHAWKTSMSILYGKQQGIHVTNWGKASFFDCHHRFLPTNHKYRKNIKDFFVGRVEKDVAPLCLSGEELYDVVSEYDNIVFGFQSSKQKFPGFDLTHNWVKQSIFWELPYWKTNLLCHNLDVMHMFENIFNTVMNLKGKTNENIKARLDIALLYNRKNMELVFDGSRITKPRASFVLEKNTKLLVYKWLKSLRFPDGHASNI